MTIGYNENNLLTFYNNNYTIDISHLEGCIVADWFGKLVYILDDIVHINNSRKEYDANDEHIYYIENVIGISILYDCVICITPTSVFIIDNYIYSQVEHKYPNVTDVYCYNKSDLIYKADNKFYNHDVEYTMNIKHILVHFNIIYYVDSNNIVHLFKDRRPLSHIKHFVIDDHDIYIMQLGISSS